MITICNIWAIFARKQREVTSQRVRIKIWQILIPGQLPEKKIFDFDIF